MLILENSVVKNQKGMGAIFFVIIITAVSLLMIKSVGVINLDILESSDIANKSQRLEYLTESCAEEYLLKIRNNKDFEIVSDSISIEDVLCETSVLNNYGLIEIITSASTNGFNKKLKITVEFIEEEIFVKEWKFINL
jgi:hypothetical protein